MELSKCCSYLAFLCLVLLTFNARVHALAETEEESLQMMSDTMEWPMAMSLYEYDGDLGENAAEVEGVFSRRSLFWHRFKHLYISYGALSANRIPCPPRSGRSYYTHNCYFAKGPVHPYTRGCSTITRCRS